MSVNPEEMVTVAGLTLDFNTAHGEIRALHALTFAVHAGEILGIVGESGSGKTIVCRAMLNLIAGNATVKSGRILFEGRDVLTMDRGALESLRGRQAAMIFQNPSTHLDPLTPVGRQVGEAIEIHEGATRAEAFRRATSLLGDMQIADPARCAAAYPHELSGGMRQRVMIAAALSCHPKLLIADEPTTALDVTVQAQILRLLRRIRAERNLTIVLISHDLGLVAEMCDRIVVMRDGRVVETGSVGQILHQPRSDYTRKLVASQPSLLKRTVPPAPRQAGAPHLLVENLQIHFPSRQGLLRSFLRRPPDVVRAVEGVSLSVPRGGSLGIVGESGSGKSTTARAIAGLIRPRGGRIAIDGQTLPQPGNDAGGLRPKLQMVFQDPFLALNPAFTVAQTLSEPIRRYGLLAKQEISRKILELMNTVELPPGLLHRRTTQLSGGQRQRVGIARALALEPQILIADEVTSALDVTIQAQVLSLFERLRRDLSLTLVVISHDLAVVRYLCDQVAVMRHGQLLECGATEQVLSDPQHEYTKMLLAAVPLLSRSGANSL